MGFSENMLEVRVGEDEIDTSGAERTGVTDFGTRQPHTANVRACQ